MARAALLGAVLILNASCDIGRLQADGRPVRDVWSEGAADLRVAVDAEPLTGAAETPVLSAPEVFAVYVPSHVDRSRDLMVGGHWVYFKLREGDWFIERGREPEPPTVGDAADNGRALRGLDGLDRLVAPWREAR